MTETLPKILITRALDNIGMLPEKLRKAGYLPIIEPMFTIHFFKEVQLHLEEYLTQGVQAVLVTSANGIRALASLTSERDMRVLTVGESSAHEAKMLGYRRVDAAGGDVDSLMEFVMEQCTPKGGTLLYSAGTVISGDLKDMLEKQGYQVTKIVTYDATPSMMLSNTVQAQLKEGEIDSILFYSPRTANIFAGLLANAGLEDCTKNITAVCLSERVKEKAEILDWKSIVVAHQPYEDALLQLIQRD